jgi:hypothetical protein
MKQLLHISKYVLLALGLSGCKKYVEIKTQGTLVPGETSNYRYLLNYTSNFEGTVSLPDIVADDVTIADSAQQASLAASSSYLYFVNLYTWQPAVYTIAGATDPEWDRMYKTVSTCNVIITETPASTGGTDAEKNELIAEAKVHRAYTYLTLVNMYAKPYDAASASTDPGVPLITTETVTASLTRNPVAEVYRQILDDLTSAYPYLPNANSFNTLPSRAAAFAVLARTHLYMGNYDQAGAWADSALAIQNTLNDMGSMTTSTYPVRLKNPEIILSKQAYQGLSYMPVALRLSDSVVNLLGATDMRYTFFTLPASYFSATLYTGRFSSRDIVTNYETRNIGPTVPEMMLTKAEALARKGDISGALTQINNLRKKRFTAANYTAVTAGTADQALIEVIKERQREFFCKGLRWFDQRRLKNDSRFSRTITRTFRGVTYTLDPNSNRYVLPISDYYRQFNPGITANP